MKENLKTEALYQKPYATLARELLESYSYPWEVLSELSSFISSLGKTLPKEEYEDRVFIDFVKYAMDYAKQHMDKKYISVAIPERKQFVNLIATYSDYKHLSLNERITLVVNKSTDEIIYVIRK